MAGGHDPLHADIYDPVRLSPEGTLFNRIVLEKLWDDEHSDCRNPDNGEPFNIRDIQPQFQLRAQMREGVPDQVEYFPGQANPLENWRVIPDYPFQFPDENHMRDYVNFLTRWIADSIHMPQDANALWKTLNFLRLNCQYSDANTTLFRHVYGFETVMGALGRHFDRMGLRTVPNNELDNVEMEEIINLCREIVKLVEILGTSTNSPSPSEALRGIMHIVYFKGKYKKDVGRILRFTHARLTLPWLNLGYHSFIYHHLENPRALSTEISLCADVTSRFLLGSNNHLLLTIDPLSKALGTLVSRFCEDDMNNMVNEEYGDQCAALDNVMKAMCRFCAKYGFITVSYMTCTECDVLRQVRRILKHALLNRQSGARLFNGRHLLFASLLIKYISDVDLLASPTDMKLVLDFAMSELPNRYRFDGRQRLKELAEKIVHTILTQNRWWAERILHAWSDF